MRFAHLGVPVRVASVSEPVAPVSLTAGEQDQWSALAPGPRRHDWLLGRAALKALLPRDTDTSALAFPHPRLSLTHAGGWGFAVEAGGDVAGVGIDYEAWGRPADPGTARFFLRPAEQAQVSGAESLLRLWTVKEALYKATPDNHDAVLVDYRLGDAACLWGAATGPRGEQMRYASIEAALGVVTVAICLVGERRRAAV
ncbi:MAG: 4'-phosphopantetheinyl transferase superfamily protein [Acidimicrobiales bacterium]